MPTSCKAVEISFLRMSLFLLLPPFDHIIFCLVLEKPTKLQKIPKSNILIINIIRSSSLFLFSFFLSYQMPNEGWVLICCHVKKKELLFFQMQIEVNQHFKVVFILSFFSYERRRPRKIGTRHILTRNTIFSYEDRY